MTHFMILKFPHMFRNTSVLAYCALIYFSISFDISSAVLIIEALHVFSYYLKAHYLSFPPFWCFQIFICMFSKWTFEIHLIILMFITYILLPISTLGKKCSPLHCPI